MCMFSGTIRDVEKTSILVRELGTGRRLCIYSMVVDTLQPVAMILPVPMPQKLAETFAFVDLSSCPKFFDHLAECFPQPARPRGDSHSMMKSMSSRDILKVHSVGDFVGSYVPTVNDFERLDERFRLPPELWSRLPGYSLGGFAVFQLSPKSGRPTKIHPMAFLYTPEIPEELFFPTFHIHDGRIPGAPSYDHMLYYQPGLTFGMAAAVDRLEENISPFYHPQVDVEGEPVVARDRRIFRFPVRGAGRNRDYTLLADANSGRTVMHLKDPT